MVMANEGNPIFSFFSFFMGEKFIVVNNQLKVAKENFSLIQVAILFKSVLFASEFVTIFLLLRHI